MSFRGLLNRTCSIRRKTESADTNLASTFTFDDIYTQVPCTIQMQSNSESNFGMRETGVAYGRAYFLYGTDIQNTDRIIPDDGEFQDGTLTVVGPPIDGAGRKKYAMVPVEYKIGGGQR